jgi:kynurenine formamidase
VSGASSSVPGLDHLQAIDLSQPLEEGMPVWPTLSRYFKTLWCSIHYGDQATAHQLVLNEHTGTHVDAPAHYVPAGHPHHRWVDEVPLEQWMGRACLVGCGALEPRSAVSADHVLGWEARHGRIESGDIVVFDFGWWRKWALRPDDVDFLTDWPGLGSACVELLLERGVKTVGVDTLSPDVFGDTASPVHKALLGEGVVIVENLANLSRVPHRFYLLAMPLKVKGGSGAPCRATALVQAE